MGSADVLSGGEYTAAGRRLHHDLDIQQKIFKLLIDSRHRETRDSILFYDFTLSGC